MNKKMINNKGLASLQIIFLITAIFAFAFIIGQVEIVSADYLGGGCGKDVDGDGNDDCSGLPMVAPPTSGNGIVEEGEDVDDGTGEGSGTPPQECPDGKCGTSDGTSDALTATTGAGLLNSADKKLLENAKGRLTEAEKGLQKILADDKASDEAIKKARDEVTSAQTEVDNLEEKVGLEGAEKGSSSALSEFFGVTAKGGWADSLLTGLQWAVIAYGVGQLLGGIIGLDDNNTQALSAALAGGAFTFQFLQTASVEGGILAGTPTWVAPVGGLVVAAAIFIILYKDYETKTVKFECLPWQAPTGGNNCELCNDNTLPCSEYRCRSLGQNCELVNTGTEQEQCVNVNPNDVNPPIITPNNELLSFGHSYTNVKLSPPGPGFNIENDESEDGCLKAFTPLQFGISTDEPSQCRIDYQSKESYEEMTAYIGANNFYAYNHTEIFSLPGAKAFENSTFELENGKDLTFYIRCQDKNGNVNEAEYGVRFCMDPSPDTTPPKIKATSINNTGCVAADTDIANVEFYTDEPADCKWSHTDQSFDNMQNTMNCNRNVYQLNAEQLFTCEAELDGIARDGTNFYVRCKDQPGAQENDRNKNEESYSFNLKGSTQLKMKNIRPNETVFGGVSPAPIELYVETLFGCNNGQSVCYYSPTNQLGDYIQFFDTDNTDGISTQRLDLSEGQHDYNVRCVDEGGNVAEDTASFYVDIDTQAPVIARIYEEEQKLKVVTVRNSECAYTFNNCDFTFEEGTNMPYSGSTTHIAEWNPEKTYYIKCRDEFLNEEAECSAIVRPSKNFF